MDVFIIWWMDTQYSLEGSYWHFWMHREFSVFISPVSGEKGKRNLGILLL
jgi:hypothetical protein